MGLDHRITVRLTEAELTEVDEHAKTMRRRRSDAIRHLLLGGTSAAEPHTSPPAVTNPDSWSFTPSPAGLKRLDEIATREGCTRDEAAKRVLTYGAHKMPPGYGT